MPDQSDNSSDEISQEVELSEPIENNVSEDVSGKGVILEEGTEQEQTKDNTNRNRSDSVASTYDISVPEEMKNEDTKPILQPETFNNHSSWNLSDMILTKKKIIMPNPSSAPVEMEVPLLYSMAYEVQPIVNEFLFELNHISECILTDNSCPFPWCSSLKRIISHASICTDMTCKECIVLRPILLCHSMQCMKMNCILPFCNQYRTAWNMFIVNMKGCPAPNLLELFSLVCSRLSSGNPEVLSFSDGHEVSPFQPISPTPNGLHSAPHSPIHTTSTQRSASISQPPSIPYPTIRPDLPIYQQPTIIPQSSTPAPILSPQPQLSHTPTPAPILSPQPAILTQSPTTLLSTQPQTGTSLVSNRRRDTPIATHYIECSICHKKRAVPISIDETVLPNFKCSLNIWDVQYSNCQCPENIQNNYTISLAGRTPQYSREQADFMYRLKQFLKNNNMGTFKQPMLFREVTAYGGCDNVIKKEGTWSRIYRGMDNYSPTETSASYRLKKIYMKYLIGYEKEVFNFHSSSTPIHQDPPLSYNSTPRSPTTITPKGYSYSYQQYSPYLSYQQPVPTSSKPYPSSTSPLPQQSYSPLPSVLPYPSIPYVPMPSTQKPYQPNQPSVLQSPIYNDLSQPQYHTYDNLPSKRFCTESSNDMRQQQQHQSVLPTMPIASVNDSSITPNEDVQTIMNLRRSISPMPPISESTGKWESLMNGVTEAVNQNNSVHNGNIHI